MIYFAHNGVEHGSAAEAAAHTSTDTVLIVILVTAAVFILMGAALWAVKHLSTASVTINKDEE